MANFFNQVDDARARLGTSAPAPMDYVSQQSAKDLLLKKLSPNPVLALQQQRDAEFIRPAVMPQRAPPPPAAAPGLLAAPPAAPAVAPAQNLMGGRVVAPTGSVPTLQEIMMSVRLSLGM